MIIKPVAPSNEAKSEHLKYFKRKKQPIPANNKWNNCINIPDKKNILKKYSGK